MRDSLSPQDQQLSPPETQPTTLHHLIHEAATPGTRAAPAHPAPHPASPAQLADQTPAQSHMYQTDELSDTLKCQEHIHMQQG